METTSDEEEVQEEPPAAILILGIGRCSGVRKLTKEEVLVEQTEKVLLGQKVHEMPPGTVVFRGIKEEEHDAGKSR
jgi:hypothetical protein